MFFKNKNNNKNRINNNFEKIKMLGTSRHMDFIYSDNSIIVRYSGEILINGGYWAYKNTMKWLKKDDAGNLVIDEQKEISEEIIEIITNDIKEYLISKRLELKVIID